MLRLCSLFFWRGDTCDIQRSGPNRNEVRRQVTTMPNKCCDAVMIGFQKPCKVASFLSPTTTASFITSRDISKVFPWSAALCWMVIEASSSGPEHSSARPACSSKSSTGPPSPDPSYLTSNPDPITPVYEIMQTALANRETTRGRAFVSRLMRSVQEVLRAFHTCRSVYERKDGSSAASCPIDLGDRAPCQLRLQ